jgi:hypothetical protein
LQRWATSKQAASCIAGLVNSRPFFLARKDKNLASRDMRPAIPLILCATQKTSSSIDHFSYQKDQARRVVVALGGNALQKRGEAMTADNQRANVKVIGALQDIEKIVKGEAGTVISTEKEGIEWY